MTQPNRCHPRCDPARWNERNAPGRQGWLLTECGICERFVGYRRLDAGKKSQPLEFETVEAVDEVEDLFGEEVT